MRSRLAVAGSGVAAEVAGEVRAFCETHKDSTLVEKYAHYFVEGYDAYGVDFRVPEYAAQRKEWTERLKQAGARAVFEAGDRLMKTGKYEEGFCAIRFVADSPEYFSAEAFERIGQWFECGVVNWALCDVLCGEVLSEFLAQGVVGMKALEPWVASPFKYQRRAAAVTLIRMAKSKWDVRPLLKMIEPLMADEEKVVQQGVGWFLREAWKVQAKTVETFLMRHKETCPRLIVQYATEKMDKDQKERFRRTK